MNKTWMILSVTSVLVWTGCAGTGKRADGRIEVDTAKYTKSVTSKSLRTAEGKGGECPKSTTEWQKDEWKKLMKYANACVQQKNWAQVERLADRLGQEDHLAPWGAYYLSLAAEARKDYARAMWMVELALKKSPEQGILLYQQGRLFWRLEEYKQAVEMFEKAVSLDENLVDAHLTLAQVYFRDQEFVKATDHFEIVLKHERDNFTALVGLAECEIHDGDIKRAIEVLARAVDASPRNLEVRLRQAYLLEEKQQDYEKALAFYKEIKRLVDGKKVDGTPGVNIDEKIKNLEVTINKEVLGEKKVSLREKENTGVTQ